MENFKLTKREVYTDMENKISHTMNSINYSKIQPLTCDKFICSLYGIDSYLIKKATLPTFLYIKDEIKPYGTSIITLYDVITPNTKQICVEAIKYYRNQSVSQEDKIINFKYLDPVGNVVGQFNIKNVLFIGMNFSELNYDNRDLSEVYLTFDCNDSIVEFIY